MLRILLFMAALLATAVFCLNCNDNGEESYNVKTWIFPNEVGDWWLYKVTDSISSQVDTILVRIEGDDTLNSGNSVTVWVNHNGSAADTSYLRIGLGFLTTDSGAPVRSDTVFIYNDKSSGSLSDIMIFPLRVGDYWDGVQAGDTVRVVEKVRIETQAGQFDAYLVQNARHKFEDVIDSKKWVVHYLGMARWDFNWLGGTIIGHQGWELIDWLPEGAMPEP